MRLLDPWGLLAAYLAIAIACTWPLAQSLSTSLPLGCEGVATVPLLNGWTIWWNAERAAHAFQHYWDAPIFFPTERTFAFSEAQPTTLVVAPAVWLTGRVALAYNLYLLGTLTLNGWSAQRLLRGVGLGSWAAFWGGVLVIILPFVSWQLGVLQLTVLWGVQWTILALWKFAQMPSWRRAAALGAAYGIAYVACNYYGLFLVMTLGPAACWLLHGGWLRPRIWLQTALAVAMAGVLAGPIVMMQLEASRLHKWERDLETIRKLSAHLRDYSDTPWPQWLDAWENASPPRADVWPLGPGWLKIIGAACGLLCGLARPSLRRWTLLAATWGGFAVVYSLGPLWEIWNLTPYLTLYHYVPGFAQIRSPFRFAVFVQMACVWLSLLVVDTLCPGHWLGTRLCPARWLETCLRPIVPSRLNPLLRLSFSGIVWVPAVTLTLALALETLPDGQSGRLRPVPGPDDLPPWVEFLRDETPPHAAIVCLPFVKGTEVGDYEETTWWMWWSMYHHHPLLNGYSGFFPEPYLALKGELQKFPDQGAERLARMGARYAVVQRRAWTQDALERHPQTGHWIWKFSDEQALIDIYEIPPGAPAAAAAADVSEPTPHHP